jgi:hypothetical protein
MKLDPEFTLSTLRISIADMIALQVRTRRSGSPNPPELLYQSLPTTAMSLMATIPGGLFAVSIPHQSELGCGYPILKSPLPAEDNFVIVYSRQRNERYEAVDILFQGAKFKIAEFHRIACRWVEENAGSLHSVPGQHVYFVPDKERWGVIRRDSGYTTWDLSRLSSGITEEIQKQRESMSRSGILARIPVWRGDKQPSEAMLPVFTRVELTLDLHPSRESRWIRFLEYDEMLRRQSDPPSRIIPDFHEWLARLTKECGFERWVFRSGMLFSDHTEWWATRDRRRTAHEGIDFAEGLTAAGRIISIPEGTPVRAISDGEIVALLDDFLGKTVVVRHPTLIHETGDIFYTLYSHIQPASESLGMISKGTVLGRVGKATNTRTPAHLHLTGAWIPRSIRSSEIGMEHINPGFAPIILVNFNDLLNI